tara:strand:- start:335 stop:685 length:351 start_codon:yes stop_codon:yes gene_type:complete
MLRIINKVILNLRKHPIFFSSFIILSLIISATQYQFWFGDYNNSELRKLKKEIDLVKLETEIIKKSNQELLKEKEKLNSGKEAIEGVARIELGMIKPGEKFYVFKEETKLDSLEDN